MTAFIAKILAALQDPKTGGLSVSRVSGAGLLGIAIEQAQSGAPWQMVATFAAAGVASLAIRTKTTDAGA